MSGGGEPGEESAESGASCSLEAAEEASGRPCPLCETPMRTRHCKYVCPRHGVVYDCSDTFY